MTLTQRAQAALQGAGVPGAIVALSAVPPVVSPMCRAGDWVCLVARTEGGCAFVKLAQEAAVGFVDAEAAAAGARAAAAAAVGPALLSAGGGTMTFECLGPPWREARLGDVMQPPTLERVLQAKRRLRDGPALARRFDVFERIGSLAGGLGKGLADGADDLQALLAGARRIGAALDAAGRDSRPCHADGSASNVMLHPDGRVRLVDFDCAGMADPDYDVAVVLNEACASDRAWEAGMEAAFGRAELGRLARCRGYAAADDLFWGLWGLSRHAALGSGTGPEYLKYGLWRLLRCRAGLRRFDHAGLLARI